MSAVMKSIASYVAERGITERELAKTAGDKPVLKSKSDIYRDCLPLLNASRVRLLDHPRLVNQLCSL